MRFFAFAGPGYEVDALGADGVVLVVVAATMGATDGLAVWFTARPSSVSRMPVSCQSP